MSEFSSSNITTHILYVDKERGDEGIGYGMIIVWYLMVKLGPRAEFSCQVLECGGTMKPMKDT